VVEGRGQSRLRRLVKTQLYAEAREFGHASVKTVGLPAALLQDKLGLLLQRFLGELGVTVVPLAEAAMEGATTRAREAIDCLIMRIVKRAGKQRKEFYTNLAAVCEALHAQWDKLPGWPSAPVPDRGQGPVFEPFRQDRSARHPEPRRIRDAYKSARRGRGPLGGCLATLLKA